MKRIPIFSILCAAVLDMVPAGSVFSQTIPAIPFTAGHQTAVGARALGLGGAFTAVSDDYSALFYNPAGLGQVRSSQIHASLVNIGITDRSTFLGREFSVSDQFTKLGSLGAVFSVPTLRGSLVFGIGYHRPIHFENTLEAEGDQEIGMALDSAQTLPFPVTDSYNGFQEGHLSLTSIGCAVEMAAGLFAGATMNFWGGSRDHTWIAKETGGIYTVRDLYEPGDEYEVMISDLTLTNHYIEKYSGLNFTGSFLLRKGGFRFGAAVETPVTLTCKRDWDVLETEEEYREYYETNFPDDIPDTLVFETQEAGFVQSKIRRSWTFRAGLSFEAGPVLLTGDAVLKDYSQIRFLTDPAESIQHRLQANEAIRKNYRQATELRAGIQYRVPGLGLELRTGYALLPSFLKQGAGSENRKVLGFGAGIPFNEQLRMDAGLSQTEWDGIPDEIISRERIESYSFIVSFQYQI